MISTRFFITKIFLRKPILAIALTALLVMANYITTTTARAIYSTIQGQQQNDRIFTKKTYLFNNAPESNITKETLNNQALNEIYEHLDRKYQHAVYTDGAIVEVPNRHNVPIPISHMNEQYAQINDFTLTQGKQLRYDYTTGSKQAIPVYVGAELAKDYPLGSTLNIHDPALQRQNKLKVVGIIEPNFAHSNLFASDSKQYYNFAIVIPVNLSYIKQADAAFKINLLSNLLVLNSDRETAVQLSEYIEQAIKLKFNIYNKQEVKDYFNQYLGSSLQFVTIIIAILLTVIIVQALLVSRSSLRVNIKEYTLNILVGLSYRKIFRIIFTYYAALSTICMLVVTIVTALTRQKYWSDKEPYLMTEGIGGLILIDWLALLTTLTLNLALTTCITWLTVKPLRRTPISIGVMQT